MCQRGGIVVERDWVEGVVIMRSWSIFLAAVRPKRVVGGMVGVEELLLLLWLLLEAAHAMEQMVPINFLVTRALLLLLLAGKSDRERISINCNIVWHVTLERTSDSSFFTEVMSARISGVNLEGSDGPEDNAMMAPATDAEMRIDDIVAVIVSLGPFNDAVPSASQTDGLLFIFRDSHTSDQIRTILSTINRAS